ncbi:MAG: glycoside hydrolase family 1 [Sphingomonas bacterium]|uniref:glycoside hydrolase family 1 protein n=1 Tax=Sphingomonas bacterium TaxID=1895847 RepID=UPI002632BD66|nr:family 1 glycosylhydrolase [Sphingomonas bacterium]MDB5703296.1 glycoside hydrolase family 1 [Sphingomonas bacterium]
MAEASEDALSRRALLAGSMGLAAGALVSAQTSAAKPVPKKLPKGFWWGTAISAHQSEGNNIDSDFWLAENVKPTLFREPSLDACDSYHRYDEDIALAARLGFNSHRFGIEWSRIEPEPGKFSEAELDHYVRVLESCHAHGLAPMVTFNHWSVPRWFAARGGFEMADSPDLFARFAEKTTAKLGPLMAAASTFNEANIARLLHLNPAYALALPLVRAMLGACARASGSDRFASVLFADIDKSEANMVAAHERAFQAIKAGPGDFPVGVTITMQAVQGVGEGNKAAEFEEQLYGPWIAQAAKSDFIGVQTYTRILVGPEGKARPAPKGAELTAAGYEFYPQALAETIRYAARKTGKPIYVTENGIGTDDDTRRIAYIDAALAGVRTCMDEGIDIRSYMCWSLLDNFEWVYGYAQRFGLVSVDRTTFKRTPKPSAIHLGKRAKANLL